MSEQNDVLTLNESRVLRITHPHKIDANKIRSVEDIVLILSRLDLYVDDKGLKGIEHLIEGGEVEDYKITTGVIKGEQL